MNEQAYQTAIQRMDALDKRFKDNRAAGWLYALQNPAFKRPVFKIGETRHPPHIRAAQLSAETGVPEPYRLVYFVTVEFRKRAEREVYDRLAEYRVASNKEFFDAPLREIVKSLDWAKKEFPSVVTIHEQVGGWAPIFAENKLECPDCGKQQRVKELAIPVRIKCANCGQELSG